MTLSQDSSCTAQYFIVEARRAADSYASARSHPADSPEGVNEQFAEVRIFLKTFLESSGCWWFFDSDLMLCSTSTVAICGLTRRSGVACQNPYAAASPTIVSSHRFFVKSRTRSAILHVTDDFRWSERYLLRWLNPDGGEGSIPHTSEL